MPCCDLMWEYWEYRHDQYVSMLLTPKRDLLETCCIILLPWCFPIVWSREQLVEECRWALPLSKSKLTKVGGVCFSSHSFRTRLQSSSRMDARRYRTCTRDAVPPTRISIPVCQPSKTPFPSIPLHNESGMLKYETCEMSSFAWGWILCEQLHVPHSWECFPEGKIMRDFAWMSVGIHRDSQSFGTGSVTSSNPMTFMWNCLKVSFDAVKTPKLKQHNRKDQLRHSGNQLL